MERTKPLASILLALAVSLLPLPGCAPVANQVSSQVVGGTLRVTVDNNNLFEPAVLEAVGIQLAIETRPRALKGHLEFRRTSLFYSTDPDATTPDYRAATEVVIPNLRLPISFERCGAASFTGINRCDPAKQDCSCVFDSGQKRTFSLEVVPTLRGLPNQVWKTVCDSSKSASLVVFVGFQSPTLETGSNTGALSGFWNTLVRETDNLQSAPPTKFTLECIQIPLKTP